MKLFVVKTVSNLGPGTPSEGVVREEDETKAIEAFIDPNPSPFSTVFVPMTRFWHPNKIPTVADFIAKKIGEDDRWPESFGTELRDPAKNNDPIQSKEEKLCRDFMEDRVVLRAFKTGGTAAEWGFSFKLWLAKKLRELAGWMDRSAGVDEETT